MFEMLASALTSACENIRYGKYDNLVQEEQEWHLFFGIQD